MIEVDDSQLEDDYREFLQRWADALEVPVGELVLRIVEADDRRRAVHRYGPTARRLDPRLSLRTIEGTITPTQEDS